jgi:1,4-dihydroxy-2-naphthoyl-CoA hydrolase
MSVVAASTFDFSSVEDSSAFARAAGLVLDEVTGTRVTGHIVLGSEHHTPWGIVHGGLYATAIETAASVGACAAVRERGQVAVGITNTRRGLQVGQVHRGTWRLS